MNQFPECFSIAGQTALVTGASRGIGAAIATGLGKAGARVIGTATTEAGADNISSRFDKDGVPGRGVVLNVRTPEAVVSLQKQIAEQEGAVTILVNNAGITRDNLLLRMKDEEWNDIISTDLTSIFLTCKTFLRSMIKARHGRIINISSVVGAMGNPGQSNYAAAKAGMIGFSKSLAREVGSRGITVNAVAPGFITTEMTAALGSDQIDEMTARIPLQRLGSVDDVAGVVLFLASPAGGYITGETIHVNGGMYMI